MRKGLRIAGLLAIMAARYTMAESNPPVSSLCDLQVRLAQGEHLTVRVEGVYLAGLEGQLFVAAGCSDRSTDIEFALKSHRLWTRLQQMSNKSNDQRHVSGDGDPVLVVFDGEFYGPPVPDPKLPEAIRKNYHPGWDNNNSMTKLVVQAIQSVGPLPTDHPCAPRKSDPNNKWPCFQNTGGKSAAERTHYPKLIHAEVPLYPALARSAHLSGAVEIEVVVENGAVVDAKLKSSTMNNQVLPLGSLENVKTWQFQSEGRASFTVTYVYKIEGAETEQPENPTVELDLPRLVTVTARPFKPTCNDCDPSKHEALHGALKNP
jgi:hypothetical protein